jgi:hypothetical protein
MGAIDPELPFLAADLTPSEELDDTEATEKSVSLDGARGGIRVRVDQDGVVHYKAHPYVSYAQKSVQRKQFDVQEEVGLRDMVAARELWRRYAASRYSEMTR